MLTTSRLGPVKIGAELVAAYTAFWASSKANQVPGRLGPSSKKCDSMILTAERDAS